MNLSRTRIRELEATVEMLTQQNSALRTALDNSNQNLTLMIENYDGLLATVNGAMTDAVAAQVQTTATVNALRKEIDDRKPRIFLMDNTATEVS